MSDSQGKTTTDAATSLDLKPLIEAKQWDRIIALLQPVVAGAPHDWRPYLWYALALDRSGRHDEARQHLNRAIDRKPLIVGRLAQYGLSAYATDEAVRRQDDFLIVPPETLHGRLDDFAQISASTKPHPWPKQLRIASNADLVAAARRWVVEPSRWPTRLTRSGSTLFTFGSCFATNLARALRDQGIRVRSAFIEEDINSTYANRHLLSYLIDGPIDGPTRAIEATFGAGLRDQLREAIAGADCAVMTVGVAPAFFDERGTFVFRGRSGQQVDPGVRMRTPSVAENKQNIALVLDGLRTINPQIRIVVTVSPVPLAGTLEMASAIVADCVSKSVLRAAVHEVLVERSDIGYWPSFEIVKWLSDHAAFPVFGADDGVSRHVNGAVVEAIVALFIEHHFDE
jgi:tetratricopeptide (TPR) repeat protein